MTVGRTILGIAIIMVAVILSIPLSAGLRKVGIPVNP